ncbi:hypothetical protein AKJ45_01230 [candidate division MSBL1 archaeon SCGC-AAA261F19]|uniref:Major facilitator superfamily (MFS) profile domain-containing protein n=1 Tax=candidate division MSBL1 archaeon SCGC-AAA261F19 TaxID=1698275 RepID=A0A133VAX9_9EURY|nr:hypothetical protein AKJ45_01230 [candidate division MSBL1 archaeon SCGC-AAA261F19]
MTQGKNLSLKQKLEEVPVGKFHWILLLALGLGWAFDAMNSGLISFGLTPLTEDLNLTEGLTGILLSGWTAGMFAGGFLIGKLADKAGRKTSLLLSLVLFSVPAGMVAFASHWELIFLLRFTAGMGSAGYMVVGSTLLSEYMPTKQRGRFVALLESSWAFGWLLASYFGLIFIETVGWRGIMLVGFLPMLFLPFFLVKIPESLRFLLSKGKIKRAREIGRDIDLKVGEEEAVNFRKTIKYSKLSTLFNPKYRKRTIMLWIHWFSIVLAYWGIFLWLPSVLASEKGFGIAKSLQFAFLITLAQIPGYWSGAWLIEKVGRKWLLVSYMSLAGVASFLFAGSTTTWQVLLFASLVSFFNLGAWGITYAYTPELYPTLVRASGSGIANGVGRIGGIFGPMLAGFLVSQFGSFYPVFVVYAVFHFISAIVVASLGIETKGRPLED